MIFHSISSAIFQMFEKIHFIVNVVLLWIGEYTPFHTHSKKAEWMRVEGMRVGGDGGAKK